MEAIAKTKSEVDARCHDQQSQTEQPPSKPKQQRAMVFLAERRRRDFDRHYFGLLTARARGASKAISQVSRAVRSFVRHRSKALQEE